MVEKAISTGKAWPYSALALKLAVTSDAYYEHFSVYLATNKSEQEERREKKSKK